MQVRVPVGHDHEHRIHVARDGGRVGIDGGELGPLRIVVDVLADESVARDGKNSDRVRARHAPGAAASLLVESEQRRLDDSPDLDHVGSRAHQDGRPDGRRDGGARGDVVVGAGASAHVDPEQIRVRGVQNRLRDVEADRRRPSG